ncbi:MAG TPA: hypothetical protein VHG35_02285 [Gemmatimonadales bacterium]|nr:hypothetical protein [Gemmatimonadales bacterium]
MSSLARLALAVGLGLIVRDVAPVAAQTPPPAADRWQLTLDHERYVWDVRLVKIAGDTLVVQQSDSLVRAPIARIVEMRRFRQTTLLVGDVHTSALDAMAGDIHDVYDLAGLTVAERRRTIQRILAHLRPKAN